MNFAQMVATAQGAPSGSAPPPMTFAQMVQAAQNAPSTETPTSKPVPPGGFVAGVENALQQGLAGVSEAAYPAAAWLNREFPAVDKWGEAIGLPSVNQAQQNARALVRRDQSQHLTAMGDVGGLVGQGLVVAPEFAVAGEGLIPSALAGATSGALQPVRTDGNSRTGNALVGAVGGAAGHYVGGLLGRAGHAVGGLLWPTHAPVAIAPDVLSDAPETAQAVEDAAGKPINPQAVARQAEAERVGTRLTPGQATGNGRLISQERNLRSVTPGVVEHYATQNRALVDALRGITDHSALPSDQESLGDMVREALKNQLAAHDQAVSDAYQAVQAQNPDAPMMSGPKFAEAAQKALHDEMSTDWLSPPIKNLLDQFAEAPEDGGRPLNFANFEHLRTRLATEAREGGNAGHAASVVRGVLEDMEPQNPETKAAADYARSLAKQGFALRDAMPALRSIENTKGGQPEGAAFARRFIINAPKTDVQNLTDFLGPDDQQAVTASLLAHLRDSALTRAPSGEETLKADAYAKALGQVAPKLEGRMAPADIEQLGRIGRVAHWTTVQPPGSYVNNSNTAVAQLAHAGGRGVAGAVDRLFGGLPIGTAVHDALTNAAASKAALTRLGALTGPGAGIVAEDVPYVPTTAQKLGAVGLSTLLQHPTQHASR